MLITLPLQKEIKVGRICQNIMKVDEFKFIALFLEFAKKCLRVFVEWEWDEKSCNCQNVCVCARTPSSPAPLRSPAAPP